MKTLLPFLMAVLLCGCVTQPQQPALPTSQVYDAPLDKVWPLIEQEVALNYPVKVVEKQSGLLTTDVVNLDAGFANSDMSKWVFAPQGLLETWNGLRVTLSVLAIEPAPGKTSVKISAHYEAFENNMYNQWMVCQSNGSLENQILGNISLQLARASAPVAGASTK